MLKTILAGLFLLPILPVFSQNYTTAAGLRFGGGIGISIQQALWKHYTAEAQLQKGFTNKLTTFTALFERHQPVFSKGTNFYLGAGPHFGSYETTGSKNEQPGVFGVSGIGGIECKLGSTLLSADLKPLVNLAGGSSFLQTQVGISLRYIFIKAPKKEHKWMFWKKKKENHKRHKS